MGHVGERMMVQGQQCGIAFAGIVLSNLGVVI